MRKLGVVFESYWFMLNKLDWDAIELEMQKYDYSDVKELTIDDFKTSDPDVFAEKKAPDN
jgi:hypothetical protein